GGVGGGDVVGAVELGGESRIVFDPLEEDHVGEERASWRTLVPLAEGVVGGGEAMRCRVDEDPQQCLNRWVDAVIGGEADVSTAALQAGNYQLAIDHRRSGRRGRFRGEYQWFA